MKKYKPMIIITSIITLLPMLAGLLLWQQLPDRIPTHFGLDNVANGWSSKPFAVFGLPGILLAFHCICFLSTFYDPKKNNISKKMFHVIFWIVPVISMITCLSCYGIALGLDLNINLILNIFIGILFMMIGNYMPKSRQSYTVGIKIPWTLASEENWKRTHRLAGWLWILAGAAFVVNAFLLNNWIIPVIFLTMVLVPVVYSFLLYRKGI